MSRSAAARANRRGEPPPSPEPLPSPALDGHTHLDIVVGERPAHGAGDEGWPDEAEVDAEIAAAAAVGIPRLVQVGVDVASSRWSAELAARHPGVLAAVAVHPNEAGAGGADEAALAEIERLAALPRVRAVGETGLDRFRTGPDGWAAQEAAFRAHIRIAKRQGVAPVIHARHPHEAIRRVPDDEAAPAPTVFHRGLGRVASARSTPRSRPRPSTGSHRNTDASARTTTLPITPATPRARPSRRISRPCCA